MASRTFTIGEFTGNDIAANITLTEVGGAIQVSVSVADGYIGDLRGLFFHIGDESLISSLSIAGSNVTNTQFGPANSVDDVDGAVISPQKFDFGVEIGSEGIGKDDIRSTTFTISSSAKQLTLADFINANPNGFDVGVRITSVGGDRQGSSKLGGEIAGDTFTPNPALTIDKVTNGEDGQTILAGTNITWTYTVANTGNVGLSNVSVLDDNGTPNNTADDFTATLLGGDANNNNLLDVGETWTYTASGTAQAGNYSNIGTARGSYNGTTVNATDPSSYFGAAPAIDIDKVTNGADGLTLVAGSNVTWTYTVNNTGNVGLSNVTVKDDNGTPNNTSDDFTATYASGDNGNGVLDVGESWVFKATGTAIAGNYSNIGIVTGVFTDDLGNSKTVNDADESSYTGETGVANTPGFWKQSQHFKFWAEGYKTTDSFRGTFGVNVAPSGVPDTLLGALGAGGGGVNALARSGTAGLLNAASDAKGTGINYVIDVNALAISVGKVGANYDSVLATLDIIDINNDLRIDVAEVKGAVKDALTNNEGFFNGTSGIQQVAITFDAMNNMPSLEVGAF